MAWSGVQAIPLRPGESKQAALDRVYAGGTEIVFQGDEVWIQQIPGDAEPTERVGASDRAWMLTAQPILDAVRPGWRCVHTLQGEGRRWPWFLQLEHDTGSMWIELYSSSVYFKMVKTSGPVDATEWGFWWRTIRRFAAVPCVLYCPDDDVVMAPSLSATAARTRYNWM